MTLVRRTDVVRPRRGKGALPFNFFKRLVLSCAVVMVFVQVHFIELPPGSVTLPMYISPKAREGVLVLIYDHL